MKARTKYQKKVAEANEALPPISENAVKWTYENLITHKAYRFHDTNTCMDCGRSWTSKDVEEKEVRCPHCGKMQKLMETSCRTFKEKMYSSVVTTFRGLQVQRIFILSVKSKKGRPAEYTHDEIVRFWINENGNVEVTARARMQGFYYDNLAMHSKIELRRNCPVYEWMSDCSVYSRYHVLPKLRRNGLVGKFPTNMPPVVYMRELLVNPHMETVVKKGQLEHIRYFVQHIGHLDYVWPEYKITLRNRYSISDIDLWYDYIVLLKALGKDTHNAYYVCPVDLKAAHEEVLSKKRKNDAEEKRRTRRMKALEEEKRFEEDKGRFFGISFTDGIIAVSVLDCVDAYFQEGEAMHHCVAECEYYKKPESLVLSARINGERVETVEVSLKTFKVLQSRGMCNKNTPYHNEIIELVNNNMNLIRNAV